MDLNDYEINSETLIVEPIDSDTSMVYELDDEFVVKKSCVSILKDSCLFFGSSFDGRIESTKRFLDCKMKVPIVIEESKNMIFFPTNSFKNEKCIWISYNNLLKYCKNDKYSTLLCFKKNRNIVINIRYNIVDNQIIRCIKLESLWNKRKSDFYKEKIG